MPPGVGALPLPLSLSFFKANIHWWPFCTLDPEGTVMNK